jgi:hypothetical protein
LVIYVAYALLAFHLPVRTIVFPMLVSFCNNISLLKNVQAESHCRHEIELINQRRVMVSTGTHVDLVKKCGTSYVCFYCTKPFSPE